MGGDQGANIFAAGYPKTQQIPCDPAAPVDGIGDSVSAEASGLTYDTNSDQYNYAWKTEEAWAGTCQQLVVRLTDGTFHRANFQLK